MDTIINCKDVSDSDTVILSAGYDRTSSYRRGAAAGPQRIVACLDKQVEFFDRFILSEPVFDCKIAHRRLSGLNKLKPEAMVDTVTREYAKHADRNKFILMLGGDHSVSIGAFQYFSRKAKARDITIVQIDAHPDLRDDDSDYNPLTSSRYAHSCVMRRALDLGFQTLQVGIRTYSREEYDFINRNRLTVFEWGKGKAPSIGTILKSIRTEKVYLTIDVDGIDPAHMPATGTPVQGGIEWNYMLKLTRQLFAKKGIVGADIVEVAPRKDDVLTEYGAAQLAYNIISYDRLKKLKKLKFRE